MENIIISPEAVSAVPAKKAFENNILPIKVKDGFLTIGISDKNNFKLINDLSFDTGYKIDAVELAPEIITGKLKEIYDPAELKNDRKHEAARESAVSEHNNIEFVNQIISGAIKTGASDIHFESYENSSRVRYRIDGHLREALNIPKSKSPAVASRLKIMADLDISEKRRPQDGRIRFPHNNKTVDIRVSTLPTSYGEKIVLRILDKSNIQLELSTLGMSEEQFGIIEQNIKLPYGMILVTGPTGSGKTTTLYAALKHIHSVEKNIMTVEDPIEYNLEGINQSAVRPEIGYDFASALRSFLRQDPDIVMVGEIRDKETAEIAIRASLTGHLVFSTLHTNDSVSAITRLIDMGIEPFLVAASVKMIIAQRLVRKLCSCKIKNGKDYLQNILKTENSYKKNGCAKCGGTGYKGRTALYEVLKINEELTELITSGAPLGQIKAKAKEGGFISLRDIGVEKINSGITDHEEVLRETML